MAYTAGNLHCNGGGPPGRRLYRYDSTDHPDTVEAAGYFNNKDDNLNLAIGDVIMVFQWSDTPFSSGATLQRALQFVVTNVVSVDAAASAGNVNIAQVFIGSGVPSSGA